MPSPIVWPAKSWNVWLAIAVAIGALFAAFVPAAAYVIAMVIGGSFDPKHPYDNLNVLLTSQVATYLPTALYFAAVLPPLSLVSLPDLGFRRPTLRNVLLAAGGSIVMLLLVAIVSAAIVAITHKQDTETAIALLKSLKTPGERINFVLVACVLAPMVEELVFRVYLFNCLTKYVPMAAAIVTSGLFFGFVHVIGTPASQLFTVAIPLGVGGMVLAYVYATTRNYWCSVITHGIFNLIGVAQVMFFGGS